MTAETTTAVAAATDLPKAETGTETVRAVAVIATTMAVTTKDSGALIYGTL